MILASACAQTPSTERKVGTRCEDCEMMFEGMPQSISWETRLTDSNEPGEPMVISGTIYKSDGKHLPLKLFFISITPMRRVIILHQKIKKMRGVTGTSGAG